MDKCINLFIGLGNPGLKYENTRHNFGFIVLDEIVKFKKLRFKNWGDIAKISFYDIGSRKIWFLKPMIFMNSSGFVVSSFAKYHKITSNEIFVFYDDFSVPLGEYRIRMNGSSGGHNGISSIIKCMHSSNFARMKLGIGTNFKFRSTAEFVLSPFSKDDDKKVCLIKKKCVKFFDEICLLGLDRAVAMLSNIG
ncbi:MAG: aminoacyl-tRNA hydrolase [Endomicrobium sp.]|jgi:PTH1 family peptidyl-tRNA hydrolase|nr:aminoacyl-tRNA hydrolase [Endomicrobium sp.]